MTTLGIILGVVIGVNFLLSIVLRNWTGTAGWLVAGLEWSRRLII